MRAAPLFLSLLLVLGANPSCTDDVAPAIPDQRVGDSSTLDLRAQDTAADQAARDGAAPDAPLADLPWQDSAGLDLKADLKPVKCTKDTDCGKPTCAASGNNDCSQTTPLCNLATGVCSKSSSVVKNAFCENAMGLCKAIPSQCMVDSDCGVPICAASGSSACIQTSPKCINGQCSKSTAIVQNTVCDANTGLCKSTGPGACKVDLDCGKPTCANATNSCTQTKPTCTNNVCKTLVTSLQNAVCDATTGLCK